MQTVNRVAFAIGRERAPFAGIRGALRKAMHGGVIEVQPLRPLALLLAGAISEACFYVADATIRSSPGRRSVA
ncbi:MAG: hypothetical protein QOH92_3043 [Chloroflexota bacterium]|jgi:hypothetical protein|nr:hypothetical protein [Chloroflexota bacterium]